MSKKNIATVLELTNERKAILPKERGRPTIGNAASCPVSINLTLSEKDRLVEKAGRIPLGRFVKDILLEQTDLFNE